MSLKKSSYSRLKKLVMIPDVVISSGETSTFERTSASRAATSLGRSEEVTSLETSISKTNPVMDGVEVGTFVVG